MHAPRRSKPGRGALVVAVPQLCDYSHVVLVRRPLLLLDDSRAFVRVPLRLLISVVAATAALWVVGVLKPVLGFPVLSPAFLGIVFVSAEVAGFPYGIATMAVFGTGYAFFYQEPRGALGLGDPHALAVLVAYTVAGFLFASIGGALRNAYAALREEHRAVTTIHEQREDLLKALTHDVRTPLNVITMNAAMLTRDAEDPAILRRAQAIKKSAALVADMLGDLVDTAHLESGHLTLERKPVDLGSFVVELKTHLEGALPLDRVDFAMPEGLPAVFVDPHGFERIVVNLLSNALKYAPSPTRVVLGATVQDGNSAVISVADCGPGISQRDLPHIFEKYYRASGTRKKEGLGIGLYGTRLLVQAHGGRIWVDSALDKGTTFYVALPTAPSEVVAASASLGAWRSAGGGRIAPAQADSSGQQSRIDSAHNPRAQ